MKTLLSLLVAGLAGLGATHASAAAALVDKPNILVILTDDMGYGELGCQGNRQIPTPHIDSIAKNGVRFTSGYVTAPICSPSRAGLLTGRYQQRFGHEFNFPPPDGLPNKRGLSLKEKTIADYLKAAGYATGMFGKWHLGYRSEFHPMKRGFDEYFGFLGGMHPYTRADGGNHGPILRGTTPVTSMDYTTDAFGRETCAFIEKHRDKPWFVYLPFNAVHSPMQATQKYLDRFPNLKGDRRTYAAMESAMDDAVGAVLAKLRELKLEDNTLIFFVSDNGGPTWQTTSRNDPLSGSKKDLLEGGIREPFMVQWKARVPAGKVDDRPVITLDIMATALAAAGVAGDAKLDGVNLLPYLTGEKTGLPHEALFWRYGEQRAVRMGDWKLLQRGRKTKLYNLAKDIGEKHDRSDQEPGKLKELEAAYEKWNAKNIRPTWRSKEGGSGRRRAAAHNADQSLVAFRSADDP
jgi:arylsulfatase A-like enzyme